MTDPQGTTPRDRLIEAAAEAGYDSHCHCPSCMTSTSQAFVSTENYSELLRMAYCHARASLDAFLAHPADLLAEIAARGDLTPVSVWTDQDGTPVLRPVVNGRSKLVTLSQFVNVVGTYASGDAPTSEETPT